MFLAHHIPGLGEHLNPHPCEEMDVADCALKALKERILYGESPMDNVNHDDYNPHKALEYTGPDPYGEHQQPIPHKTSSFATRVANDFKLDEQVHQLGDGTFALVNESVRKWAEWACGVGVTIVSSGASLAALSSVWRNMLQQNESEETAEDQEPSENQRKNSPVQVPERGEAALSASIHGASTVTSPVITRSVHNTVSNSLSAFLKRTQFNSSSSSSSADDCDTDTSAS